MVVASGHYHSPRVPDIPGLKEWKSAWPERVQHSKRYRVPNEFKDQVCNGTNKVMPPKLIVRRQFF